MASTLEANYWLQAFVLGADECLSKPIDTAELDRRMRSVVRQLFGRERPTIYFGEGFSMEVAAYMVRHGTQYVPLTRTQFELLHCLLRHRGRALHRERRVARSTAHGARVQFH